MPNVVASNIQVKRSQEELSTTVLSNTALKYGEPIYLSNYDFLIFGDSTGATTLPNLKVIKAVNRQVDSIPVADKGIFYKGISSNVLSTTDNFQGNGTKTAFVLTHGHTGESPSLTSVKINNVATTSYTFDATSSTITFSSAPSNGASIAVAYSYTVYVATLMNEDTEIIYPITTLSAVIDTNDTDVATLLVNKVSIDDASDTRTTLGQDSSGNVFVDEETPVDTSGVASTLLALINKKVSMDADTYEDYKPLTLGEDFIAPFVGDTADADTIETIKAYIDSKLDLYLANYKAEIAETVGNLLFYKADRNQATSKIVAGQYDAPIVEVTSSRNLQITDWGCMLLVNSSSDVTLTIPTNASVAFDVGAEIEVYQYGTGGVYIAGATGVTLRVGTQSTVGNPKIVERYASMCLKQLKLNEWAVQGEV